MKEWYLRSSNQELPILTWSTDTITTSSSWSNTLSTFAKIFTATLIGVGVGVLYLQYLHRLIPGLLLTIINNTVQTRNDCQTGSQTEEDQEEVAGEAEEKQGACANLSSTGEKGYDLPQHLRD